MKIEDLKVGMKIIHYNHINLIRTITAIGKDNYLYNQIVPHDYEDKISLIVEYSDIIENIKYFNEVKQKKKIILYRYTYQRENKSVFTVNWDSDNQPDIMNRHLKIVKTETKEIEID